MQHRHHDCRTSTAALSTAWCFEAGYVAWILQCYWVTTEGQTLWQPGGAEEDSHLHDGSRHLRLAYDKDEEDEEGEDSTERWLQKIWNCAFQSYFLFFFFFSFNSSTRTWTSLHIVSSFARCPPLKFVKRSVTTLYTTRHNNVDFMFTCNKKANLNVC